MSDHPHCDCNRRSFLRGAGLTLAGFGINSLLPSAFLNQAMAAVGPFSNRRLLFIFLRGGNDGINTVIPGGDPDYNTTNRPTLYIPNASSLDLGNGFARLHPSMGQLLPLYATGDLAVVHRVGYPNNTKSHFDDQRVWENGDPTHTKLFEGWLYRYIEENAVSSGVMLPALSVQSNQPVLLRGAEPFVNIANPNSFDYIYSDPKKTKITSTFDAQYSNLSGLEPYRPLLTDTSIKLVDTLDEYRSWSQATWDPKDPNTGFSLFPVSDATNPPTSPGPFSTSSYGFFRALKVCALSLLESDAVNNNGTRVAGCELGSFDTHNAQGAATGSQAALLSWLAYGLKSLQVVMSGAANDPRAYPAIWNDTVVTTLSEFGRTSKENGSVGTDHASASCLFIAGGTVNGGVYNCDAGTWPAGVMFGDSGRYLTVRTDYRAIFWEILRDHMGADPAKVNNVFPGYTGLGLTELGLIA
ncbi:MAG TPA: DUF1501 domain-containing protein [Candidatus Polarisedimenticolia bacterium]|nr:DUF1501 domain-containing protein [Candidatus Polarisedimenticolia bacterium]